MALLSHELPWTVFGSMFEYRPARSHPGPQYADIFAKQQPPQQKQVEYFAAKFADALREHTRHERAKVPNAGQCAARAQTWKTSVLVPNEVHKNTTQQSKQNLNSTGNVASVTRGEKNEELRLLQESLSAGWPPGLETREICSEELLDSGICAWWLECVPAERHYNWQARHIDDWIQHREDSDRDFNYADSHSGRPHFTKTLIIAIATTRDPDKRRHHTETLLLLAHHPIAGFQALFDWPSPRYILNSIASLKNSSLQTLLFLNILTSLRDDTIPEITSTKAGVVDLDEQRYARVQLLPCPDDPLYAGFHSYKRLIEEVCEDTFRHDHDLQYAPLFRRFFLGEPRIKEVYSGDKKCEVPAYPVLDVLADQARLKEFCKTLWQILITISMLEQDVYPEKHVHAIEWEVLGALDLMFQGQKLTGRTWVYDSLGTKPYEQWEADMKQPHE